MTTTGFETEKKPGGVSEFCLYSEHDNCRSPNCVCSCHQLIPANLNIPTPSITAGPEKACPKCGSKRPFIETYCRMDGERLASLLCGVCGAGMNVEDLFCFNCGAPKGQAKPKEPKVVVTVPAVEYEQQVLKGLQEELSVQSEGNEVPSAAGAQTVVEQPMGIQGSFKLVNAPSNNKVRQPLSQPVRPSKLPIKPS